MKKKQSKSGSAPANDQAYLSFPSKINEVNNQIHMSKQAKTENAIEMLRLFYFEAKKEFKKMNRITATSEITDESASLTFYCDGFNLSLEFTETK